MYLPIDLHTHRLPADPTTAIVHLSPWERMPHTQGYYSVGIHPWSLTAQGGIVQAILQPASPLTTGSATPLPNFGQSPAQPHSPMETGETAPAEPYTLDADALLAWARRPQVLAIGEAGIDHLAPAPIDHQTAILRLQAELAETVRKPLLLHLVRSTQEILRLRRQIRPTVPWIIHGFRGNATLARQLLDHGFSLSYGARYQPQALLATPKNRLFIETDQAVVPILSLYARAATLLQTTPDDLLSSIKANIRRDFFSN